MNERTSQDGPLREADGCDPFPEDTADIDFDCFSRSLIRELAATLEDTIGADEAKGYLSVVGAAIGEKVDRRYRRELSLDQLSREDIGRVLVDFKRRIGGRFEVVEENEDRLVFQAATCPFGDAVIGHPTLCMMTSNVFGRVAADNLGYAAVELEETIAKGHSGCRIVVHLRPKDGSGDDVREYVGT